MICVVLSDAAYDAIASRLLGADERSGPIGFIQIEAEVVDSMRAMRWPSESYSEVILKLVELKTSDLK